MSDTCFKSKGNICVKLSNDSLPLPQIFFTPDDDSTVRRGDKRYAVFWQESSEDCLVKKLGAAGEGVPINVNADLPGLVKAAAQQILVEVAVEKNGSDLALCAITIPAPGNQK